MSKLTLSSNETVAGQNETFLPEYRDNGIPIHCLDFTSETTLPHSAAVQTYLGEDAAKRLAACWNACDGIETDKLETFTVAQMVAAAVVQRDDLLAALTSLVLFTKPSMTNAAALNNAHQAIAKATGGDQ
ncbi:hypothetical protein [Pseudomonas sp.]|uniref:hypothetical protein n=1 Tax=Pseudomonas sp. TaxID=306 RepID=UPI003FD8BA45